MAAVLQKHSRVPRKARRIDAGLEMTQSPQLDATGKPMLPERARSKGIGKRPLATLPDAERQEIARQVLERYIHGEQVAEMAAEYNTSDVTIYALLLREHEGVWADIQKARALARLERSNKELDDAKKRIEGAADPLSLARFREMARFAESSLRSAQWELERLLHRLYGQKQEVTHNVNVDLGDRLRRARERVIEAEVLPAVQQISEKSESA